MEDFKYKSVLLIDDSYIDNLINSKIIEGSKFADNIVIMDSPVKAMEYLKECLNAGSAPEIVFLDIRMPGMNGFEFVRQLEELKPALHSDLKIYMLSSSLDPNDLKKVENSDLVAKFIGKPLTARTLAEI